MGRQRENKDGAHKPLLCDTWEALYGPLIVWRYGSLRLRSTLQAEQVGLPHRKSGLLFQLAAWTVPWGGSLPRTVFPSVASLRDPEKQAHRGHQNQVAGVSPAQQMQNLGSRHCKYSPPRAIHDLERGHGAHPLELEWVREGVYKRPQEKRGQKGKKPCIKK